MEVCLKAGLAKTKLDRYHSLGISHDLLYKVINTTGYGYTITVPQPLKFDVAREDFEMVPDAAIDREIVRSSKEIAERDDLVCKAVKPSQSNKADSGKSNPLLIEVDLAKALAVINRVLDYGAEKYERAGWKKVEPERYNAAARRHRRDRDVGQMFDAESGLAHLAHEACNNLFQLQMLIEAHPELDFYRYNKPPQDHKK